jgi:hypothetical protein
MDAAGNVSTSSAAVAVTTPSSHNATAPTVPANLKATVASADQVNLTWTASADTGGSGLAGYNVYRDGTKLNSTLVTTTSYGDVTVSPDTTYSYKVEAVDGAGNKSAQTAAASVTTPNAPDTTPPATPQDLKASATGATQVNLTWNASTDTGGSGLAGYNIYRDGTMLNVAPITATTYIDSSVSAGTTYQYTVQAVDQAGNTSNKTDVVSVTTLKPSTGGGSGNTGGGNSGGSHPGSPSGPIIITVVNKHDRPVANARVTIAGQTTTTNSRGIAYFTSLPSGKQAATITSGSTTIAKSVRVSPKKSSRRNTTQRLTLSLSSATLNPALLFIPVIALAAGGLIIFRPWSGRMAPVSSNEPEVVSSVEPGTPEHQPGHKFETPGTVYSPKDKHKDQ